MSSRKDLERAFKLIKRDQTDEALSILRPIVVEEPDNVHAWWLLAYAETEPRAVREALVQVLTLDPNYSNAPKAREMLEKLNEEYPPDAQELAQYPELAAFYSGPKLAPVEPSPFGSDFEELPPIDTPDLYGEDVIFQPETFPEHDYLMGQQEEPLLELTEDPFAEDITELPAEEEKKPEKKRGKKSKPTKIEFEPEPVLDEEVLAAREEHVASRQGRGRRMILSLVGLILLVLLAAAIVIGLQPGKTKTEVKDPGQLETINVDSQQVIMAQGNTQAQLASANLGGNSQIVLAGSQLGKAFYIQICGSPSPNLPQQIEDSMAIAAQQAPTLQGQVDAVGVTIDDCSAAKYDNLYRAVVRIDDALAYANGTTDWATFVSKWKTS